MFATLRPFPAIAAVPSSSSSAAVFSAPWRPHLLLRRLMKPRQSAKFLALSSSVDQEEATSKNAANDDARQFKRSADWKAAKSYKDSGVVFDGKVEGFNNGGLLIRLNSILGFLPFPLLCPDHSWKDPSKSIQEVAKDLIGSSIFVRVVEASEEENKLIFSEKDARWAKYSSQIEVGDVFDGLVGSLEDYGAFVHLRFPDGCYHLTGLVHVSEVSWDLVHDVRDFLNEGDQVKVKIIQIEREKSRISLSIKQLEDDPLLETLDKVIYQEEQVLSDNPDMFSSMNKEPLPGLESICKELSQEDGITDVRLGRQGLEKRVVSQDLELWLSNMPVNSKQFTLLARAGRRVQEVYLTTTLDQDAIKKAVQQVLGRIP